MITYSYIQNWKSEKRFFFLHKRPRKGTIAWYVRNIFLNTGLVRRLTNPAVKVQS